MKRLRIALAFLTIVPAGRLEAGREQDFAGSFLWFPLVGLGIGGVLVGVHRLISMSLPPLVAGACTLLVWILVTGAMHLDGLGDTCDGLYAGRSPEDRLRIMKDPHVGAMAVVAITGLLLMKFAFVSSLTSATIAPALTLAPCVGRYGMTVLGTLLPYARTDAGVGAAFVQQAHAGPLLGATAISILACGWLMGVQGWVIVFLAALALAVLGGWFRWTLHGVTGDTLGASGELLEVLVLGAVVWLGRHA